MGINFQKREDYFYNKFNRLKNWGGGCHGLMRFMEKYRLNLSNLNFSLLVSIKISCHRKKASIIKPKKSLYCVGENLFLPFLLINEKREMSATDVDDMRIFFQDIKSHQFVQHCSPLMLMIFTGKTAFVAPCIYILCVDLSREFAYEDKVLYKHCMCSSIEQLILMCIILNIIFHLSH